MQCPYCNHADTRVTDSRIAGEGQQIRRRRECLECGERFTTYEVAELSMPRIVKADERREAFDIDKLKRGIMHALEKRPVSVEDVEAAVASAVVALAVFDASGMRRRKATRSSASSAETSIFLPVFFCPEADGC